MKRLVSIVTATLLTISLANGKENTTKPTAIVVPQLIATPDAQGHAKKIVKSKVVNLKVHRYIAIDDDDDIFVQEDDLATGYRRRDLTKIEHPDGISERVRWRLFLARQLAMMKYRELHG
jgi:hypothetical protein